MAVDVAADPRRQLHVIDPAGRELLMSVGAAIFNLRLAIRRHGRSPVLRLSPTLPGLEYVARIVVSAREPATRTVREMVAAIPRRHTNRRPYSGRAVPASVISQLKDAAAVEGAVLSVPGPGERDAVLETIRVANNQQEADARYRDELTFWTQPSPERADGVPRYAFGPHDPDRTMPLRDFALTQPGVRTGQSPFEAHPKIVVLSTAGDTPKHWVRAGQALQRVLLTASVHGVSATPMTQPLEIPDLRRLLTHAYGDHAVQMILRLGYGQATAASPRRPLRDMLVT
ncbi:Acg family FMN-binding oxidoreductase [Actinoplanes sp. NPDC049316]|uniref:Acg family FMN-binding oxidoreductase n=1 Tax=Actinoplanes sp. NPDC049316 TaxID=3154727 RepID=UPI00341A8743